MRSGRHRRPFLGRVSGVPPPPGKAVPADGARASVRPLRRPARHPALRGFRGHLARPPSCPGSAREGRAPRPGAALTLQQAGDEAVHVQLPVRHLVGTRLSSPQREQGLLGGGGGGGGGGGSAFSPTSHAAFRPRLQLPLGAGPPPTPSPPSSEGALTRPAKPTRNK